MGLVKIVVRIIFCGGFCQEAGGFQGGSCTGLVATVLRGLASSPISMSILPFECWLLKLQIGIYNTRCIGTIDRHVSVVPTVVVCQDSRHCGDFYFVSVFCQWTEP